jgi:hypothetical protein
MPRRSWTPRGDRTCHRREHGGLRVTGRERKLDPAFELLDAHGDLHEGAPDRLEGGSPTARPLGRRAPERMQQPVGTHVQEEPELIGLPARARRLVGSGEALHVLDQVLDGPASAEHLLVERLAAPLEVGDDEARVAAQVGRLDAGDELARAGSTREPCRAVDGIGAPSASSTNGAPRIACATVRRSRGAWS